MDKPLTNLFHHCRVRLWEVCLLMVLVMLLAGCGGGGSSRSTPPTTPPTPPPTPQPPTQMELQSASLLASQASMGVTYDDLVAMAELGPEAWIDSQITQPTSHTVPLVEALVQRREAGDFENFESDVEFFIAFRRYAWWQQALSAPDVLRQRVALALSEILVISDNVDAIFVNPYAASGYWDMLLNNSFGNYRTLLKAVALNPTMGIYLSHVNNRKANPAANTFPDENFAREVMQLFSIGLYELNPDGSRRLDANNAPIPTYDNDDIREFAKIFTGLSYGEADNVFGQDSITYRAPMQMFEEQHEPGTKTLLRGFVVPANQAGMQDVDDAIDNLFNHPNVGPFIGYRLIQRLTTSNPSPAYIQRVSNAFNNDGSGVRGNMRAVVKAILLDPEAAASSATTAGKVREPMLRNVALLRALKPSSADGTLYNSGYLLQLNTGQHPLASPSVFNFFLPDHTPAGELDQANLVAPELSLTTNTTIAGITNIIDFAINAELATDLSDPPFAKVNLDFSDYEALAGNVDDLLDRVDLVFTAGQLSSATRSAIRGILTQIDDLAFRAKTALYLVLVSPDYAVQS